MAKGMKSGKAVTWGKGSRGTAKRRVGNKSPSAAVRAKYGGGKGLKKGSFPVNSVAHAKSAIKLRGHSSDPSAVLSKVSRSRYAKSPGVRRLLAGARKGVGK